MSPLLALFFGFMTLIADPSQSDAAESAAKTAGPSSQQVPDTAAGISRSGQNVQVPHSASDRQIAARLQRIFEATGWFTTPAVDSREGIVTLKGQVAQKSQKEWAESLTRDTEGVIAVINQIEVPAGQWFDLRPAEQETKSLLKKFSSFTPYLLASILVMVVVGACSVVAVRVGRKAAQRKFRNTLMIEIVAKLFALPVVLMGLYIVLRISGLTGIAVTILGGTGAVGLVAGFALKNILENYFSGVMLSISNPYSVGDTIRVNGQTGVVQTLTTRGTILVDYDGNHVIIPNSTIYNTTVVNETTNPSGRVKFSIAVSYDESPQHVRETILGALKATKGVLEKPDTLVMLSSFGPSAIVYDVYFWIDSVKSSGMKMKSLAMENVRAKLCEAKINIPGEIRKVVFTDQPGFATFETHPSKPAHHQEGPAHAETAQENGGLLDEASKGRGIDHGSALI